MIYLACPYTHEDPDVVEKRFINVNRAACALINQGNVVCSPISQNHPIAKYGLPVEWEFWEKYDTEFLKMCDQMYVLTADGWDTSVGVAAEIKIAEKLGIPVTYISPEELGVDE
jgi:hypothetical protein